MRKFIVFFVVCASLMSLNADESSDAVSFVKGVVDEALSIVNHNSMPPEEKRKELSKCINKYLDIKRTTQSVFAYLGYKALTPENQEKVQQYLRKYLLDFYASPGKLTAVVDAKLKNKITVQKVGGNFQVTTHFNKGNESKANTIVWVVKDNLIYYVEIEGVNQIITLRSEMSEQVKSADNLMNYVQRQLEEGK